MSELKDIAILYGGLAQHPAFAALIQQLEANLKAQQDAVFASTPNEFTAAKVAEVRGFKLCLDQVRAIPAGSAAAFDEMKRAEQAIWGRITT